MTQNVLRQPGKISGEDFDAIMAEDQAALDAHDQALHEAGVVVPRLEAAQDAPQQLPERDVVLPAGAVIGGNVLPGQEGLEEVDPHTAKPLGAVGLHGEGLDEPQ